jgi:hypothetical protein
MDVRVYPVNPSIDLSAETLKQLSDLAVPFVDTTPEAVIKKLIKFRLEAEQPASSAPIEYSALSPPDLSHTKIVSAKFEGELLPNPNWNRIRDHAIRVAAKKLNDVKKLDKLVLANHVIGQKTDQGYSVVKPTGLSVQGQDANNAWKSIAHLCQALGLGVEVVFAWYNNLKAVKPGEIGKLAIKA